jgi:enoyl-CoA hydratase
MRFQDIEYRVDGQVAVLTLDRPAVRNAQSRRLLEELDAAFAHAAGDADVRVIVLCGAGEHFSAGHDLGSPEEKSDREARPVGPGLRGRYAHSREQYVDKTLRWRGLPKPTLAAVQGYCIFGGWMIASAMDLIFAADDAMFLAGNFQYLSVPWDIHPRKVKELLFESRFIDADEALALGLVNRTVPRARLLDETLEYAHRIAQNDPFQLRMAKLAVNQMQDQRGFTSHIASAHAAHMLSLLGERDADYALRVPEGRRRPMVERAFENYKRRRDQRPA